MEYTGGRIGRIFIAKVEHGEDILQELKTIARKEKIQTGCVFIVGALKKGSLVACPEKADVPPRPVWKEFEDAREVIGWGTLVWNEQEPHLHLHVSVGKGGQALTGCLRNRAEAYLLVEVAVVEVEGVQARRELDPFLGLEVLRIFSGGSVGND